MTPISISIHNADPATLQYHVEEQQPGHCRRPNDDEDEQAGPQAREYYHHHRDHHQYEPYNSPTTTNPQSILETRRVTLPRPSRASSRVAYSAS
ncbi:uncharacterized protein B0I36DRAFT_335336 [Microdochium trichocladiopsis]|uniref:Uncharacterized protein n=1 Tax=Microdochium trichocladiopsis TaxID=1682393 RepID=A0A9P9BK55_9PEZI|nr:uncharacterized protein B0I36DRAFT_335336 [Microdochium trichocladiopsis]KAH7018121.1 hypothetical protein B0I36DRAFT_335336 [Microdochium trichocladiopsis]